MAHHCVECGAEICDRATRCRSCGAYVSRWGEEGFAQLKEMSEQLFVSYEVQERFIGKYGTNKNALGRTLRGLGFQGELERKNAVRGPKDFWRHNHHKSELGDHCAACGATDDLEVHHIVPKDWGGRDEPSNLELRCSDCHRQEHERISKAIREQYGTIWRFRNLLLQEHQEQIRKALGLS